MSSKQYNAPNMLIVNAGSSSVRLELYALESTPRCIAKAHFKPPPATDPKMLLDFVRRNELTMPDLVMHRVVHGGDSLREPCVINLAVEAEIERLKLLAPLHNGMVLDWIYAVREAFSPTVWQAACFDTGFYSTLPLSATTYALPKKLCEQYKIRRYGFHGLAHQSMLEYWCEHSNMDSDRRVISLQLGAGCSVTATDHGCPVETSMGFSPLDGLIMATRCGDLDPAVALYLIEQGGLSTEEVGKILNEYSGLHGISGQSGDMRLLLESDTDDAALAITVFCHQVRKYLGAYLAVLGGADAILFGGGIGENAPAIRAQILDHFDWAGIRLSAERNNTISPDSGGRIHAENSLVEIWVTPTDEGRVMANSARELLAKIAQSDQPSVLEI